MKTRSVLSGSVTAIEDIIASTGYYVEGIYAGIAEAIEQLTTEGKSSILFDSGDQMDFAESLLRHLESVAVDKPHTVYIWDKQNNRTIQLGYKGNNNGRRYRNEDGPDGKQGSNRKADPARECAFFKTGTDIVKLNFNDILYFQSEHVYVYIHIAGKKIPLRAKLDQIERFMGGHGFFRIHQRYIVNIKHIERMTAESIFVGGHEFPLSKKFKKQLLEGIGVFM